MVKIDGEWIDLISELVINNDVMMKYFKLTMDKAEDVRLVDESEEDAN